MKKEWWCVQIGLNLPYAQTHVASLNFPTTFSLFFPQPTNEDDFFMIFKPNSID